eukprot:GFUD01090608.1.p1 GENE.GFUD01090608.1~~GFUD01090608.1.p1  ORF type:complete len:397 (+),score=79.23 GFUD01090608.1:70-1260(+)
MKKLPLLLLLLVLGVQVSDAQDEILLTGGYGGGGALSSSELLVSDQSPCQIGPFNQTRHGHVTFTTNGGTVATCGGYGRFLKGSCLVLNNQTQTWERRPEKMKELLHDRKYSSVVLMPTGVYVLGGFGNHIRQPPSDRPHSKFFDHHTSSEFLPSDTSEWMTGPTLKGKGAGNSCAVRISDSSLLLIGGWREGTQVRELDTTTGKWKPLNSWPQLKVGRLGHACVVVDNKVLVAGGFIPPTFPKIYSIRNDTQTRANAKLDKLTELKNLLAWGGGGRDGNYLKSTEIIDLSGRTIKAAGDLNTARTRFGMVLTNNGAVAFGGKRIRRKKTSELSAEEKLKIKSELQKDFFLEENLASVERWDKAAEQWVKDTRTLGDARRGFGSVAVPKAAVCGDE